ncbi:hypothetical protein [Terriglobus roseus]|uniref:Uncharacterized protein n=1 Tax=Terriglobus roseus TaxID=392734 RepID=A0A1H4PE83_9BACT|nr:hypothetical protein [Terriglobus roseus]SEC05723.1 hypothetical protein SAMN05443244_2535 [Terriglobus roseus]
MRRNALIATALLSPVLVCAQKPGPKLELNLEARDVVRGVPTTFHIILRNIGQEDIRLPEPALGCASALDGTVLLVEKYTPTVPGLDDGFGPGCTADRPYSQDILKRARSWVLLRPGGYLERVASPGRMRYQNHGAGTYDLCATYTPPVVTPEEARALASADYVFPRTKLTSRHILLKKDR